jgi:general secretion pathway protein N
MSNGAKLALLGVTAFIVFLITTLPASLLTHFIANTDSVHLERIQGTIWRGSVQQVHVQGTALGSVTWQVHPWSLFLGKLKLSLSVGQPATDIQTPQGTALVSINVFRTIAVHTADLTATADWVFTQAAIPIAADGRFLLHIESAVFTQEQLPLLSAQLDWLDAQITYPQVHELGGYRFKLQHHPEVAPEHLAGTVQDMDGAFNIDGTVKIQQNGDYQLAISVSTEPTAPQDLKRVLPLLGDMQGDGSIWIERQGNLLSLL